MKRGCILSHQMVPKDLILLQLGTSAGICVFVLATRLLRATFSPKPRVVLLPLSSSMSIPVILEIPDAQKITHIFHGQSKGHPLPMPTSSPRNKAPFFSHPLSFPTGHRLSKLGPSRGGSLLRQFGGFRPRGDFLKGTMMGLFKNHPLRRPYLPGV